MRLIDLDEIEYFMVVDSEGKPRFKIEIGDGLPIVKAIPIEWIKNYARRKASKGFTEIDCYWQYWEEDVLKMVADWEKENEGDHNIFNRRTSRSGRAYGLGMFNRRSRSRRERKEDVRGANQGERE